ncbi:MAG TPA: DUF6263 family protein [Sedimentisphaerales bacterium]|nr:DUF6263 family protein [Sedimentisphaerales bacterium]
MALKNIIGWLVIPAVFSLVFWAGCESAGQRVEEQVKPALQPPKVVLPEQVSLALKYTAGDWVTYKVITESERTVKFEGSLPANNAFKGGTSGNRSELTFTQQILDVDEKGNATAEITLKELKFVSKLKDDKILDFDSTREQDSKNTLAKLIGASYVITVTPAGEVVKVSGTEGIKTEIRGGSSAARTATEFIGTDEIKRRHTLDVLPPADKNMLHKGQKYSRPESLNFGLMGAQAYERVYTLEDITDKNSRIIAKVQMEAIPAAPTPEQATGRGFAEMSDNTTTYTGWLKLDVTTGKLEECLEKLRSEWIVVDPSVRGQKDVAPAAVRMIAGRFRSIERIY